MASESRDLPTLHALLIGADCYLPNRVPEGSYSNLGGCIRDVELVEDFLRTRLRLNENRLVKLTSTGVGATKPPEPPDRWPTYENIVAGFQKLTWQANPGDHVYIHYSGHGGRTPTLLPGVKGKGGIDEALVPIDIGSSTARYLRDVEMACLLQKMITKGLRVTLVLDSCHSGGSTRGPDSAIRGVEFIDRIQRPSESLVGTPEELRSAWESQLGSHGTRSLASAMRPAEYVLLAACRPSEVANEYAFEGKRRNGALTYWLLDTLKQEGSAPTFQMIHERVVVKIHETFPGQTSILIGDPGRVAFQDLRIEPAFTVPVAAVDVGSGRLTLSAGLSAGLAKGTAFVIHPSTETDLTRLDTRKAWVRLTRVLDADSDAEIVEQFQAEPPAPGDKASLVGATTQALVRNVRLVRRDLKPLTDDDSALLVIKRALPGNGWVELIDASEQSASFIVRLTEDGAYYEICTPDYEPIHLSPALSIDDVQSPQRLVLRLVHLAKYQAVLELENKAPGASLQKKLGVEILALPDDFREDDNPWPEPKPLQESIPTIRSGQWICLRLTNRSSLPVNIVVLDLQPAWGIVQVYPPDSDFEELAPQGEPLLVPLRACLPDGYSSGVDTIKVLATIKPTSFRSLMLPPLDQPLRKIPSVAGQSRGADCDPLVQLLDVVSMERPPTRDVSAATAPGREWASVKVQVRIQANPETEGRDPDAGSSSLGGSGNGSRASVDADSEMGPGGSPRLRDSATREISLSERSVVHDYFGTSIRELISAQEISRRVNEMALEIGADYAGKTPLVVGTLKGAWIFMADLVRTIPIPLECDFLKVSTYGMTTSFSGHIDLQLDLHRDIRGEHVLLVEDIIETGEGTTWQLNRLRAKCPASLRLCALMSKPSRRKVPIRIDYLGFTVPDCFVVGYGLDKAERYRELNYVGYIVAGDDKSR